MIKTIYLIDEFPDTDGSSCLVVADVVFDAKGEYVSHKAYFSKFVAVNTLLAMQEIILDAGQNNGEFINNSSPLKGVRMYVCTNKKSS